MASNYYEPGTVTPECEVVLAEGGVDLETYYNDCAKNPGHKKFIPVNQFTEDDLRPECRSPRAMEDILNRCILTTKVKVPYTSLERPKMYSNSEIPYPYGTLRGNDKVVRYGTGSIVEAIYHQPIKGKACPCLPCRKSDKPETTFWWVRARTATHVIHDKSEAERAEFECFFDSNDMGGVRTLYGIDTFQLMNRSDKTNPNDVCDVLCVTHDHQTVAIFHSIIPGDYFLSNPTAPSTHGSKVIISHPHGCSKRITVGEVLYLTVPISHDYPINTPMPFKKETRYRLPLTSGKASDDKQENQAKSTSSKGINGDDGQIKSGSESSVVKSDVPVSVNPKAYTMKERLDAIKNRHYNNETEDKVCTTDYGTSSVSGERESFEKYVVEFYLIYTKEQCLKGLVTSALLDQKKSGVSPEHLINKAYEEVFRVFLGKEYKVDSLSNESGSPSFTRLQHWVNLLNESNQDFLSFKTSRSKDGENKTAAKSIVVSWFAEVEKNMETMLYEIEHNPGILIKDLIPTITDNVIVAGLNSLSEYEKYITTNTVNSELPGNGRDKGDDAGDDDDDKEEEPKDERKSHGDEKEVEKERGTEHELPSSGKDKQVGEGRVHDKNNDGDKNNDNRPHGHNSNENEAPEKVVKEKEDEGEATGKIDQTRIEEETVCDGSTFTLPPDAKYAFRVYPHSPGWISFPPGTIMASPDGTQTPIGEPRFEFKHPSLRPEQAFVTYDTPTCKGSSGATVYSDMLGQCLGTYFPHSGNVVEGRNQSGIRDNFVTLYSKSSLFTPQNEEVNKPPRIIEVARTYLSSLREIMKRT